MPTADAPLRLKGNPYARPDYFHTDVSTGVTRTPTGLRVCTLPSEFLLGFRDALVYECGGAYRKVLKGAGRKWGNQFAVRFGKDLADLYQRRPQDLPAGLVHTALADCFAANGYGTLTVERVNGVTVVALADSVMPALVRESDRPVDVLMAGMIGAVFAHLRGEALDAVQTECPSLGADRSRFVVGPADAVAAAEAWLDAADAMPSHTAILDRVQHPPAR